MPLENSLNASPYFDDYDQAKEFYKILFKPGVAVQTRELNQLQTILQNQIERFGDHIFKSGTVISGVNFSYLPNYSYVKILDVQNDGQPSLPSSYVDYFVKSDLNLTARVVNYQDGLESKSPDLKTLYMQYVSSSDADGANSGAIYTSFAPGQSLTVFSKQNPIFAVTVTDGGLGFSNSDTAVVLSSIIVTGNTIAFANGETLTQSTTGAKVDIASINTTAIANTIILRVKPRTVDLTNNSVNAVSWTLATGYNIVGGSSGATANVVSLIGSGAQALLTTDTQGIVQTVTLSSGGTNYSYLPYVTIKTSNAVATVGNLNLVPQNYKTTITVGNSSINSVGTGYAFGVSAGLIYQKGQFLRVDPQVIIVDKYTLTPNAVAVGFKTEETIVNAFEDESLYDNASNTTNYTAPGADRLKLTPTLITLTSTEAAANVDFFSLAEWKDGNPFKENRTTMYSNLGDEMARRTLEAQGNFVISPFLLGSKDLATTNTTNFTITVNPGTAYIRGYRTAANYNTYLNAAKATTTQTETNKTIAVSYGNYVKVKELAGYFNFKTGATVSIRSVAKQYVSTATVGSTPAITPAGSEIGTARIRSLVLDNGDPGTPSCVYKLYLFDVKMNAGFSFRDARGVYFDNTEDGIADIVLEYDATTSSNVAFLTDTTFSKMLFGVGQPAIKSITNLNYQYRTTSDATLQLTSGGTLAVGPLGTGLTFPYNDGAITSHQKQDFIILPTANAQAAANVGGSISLSTSSNVATGTSTTFDSDFKVGDFVKFANATASVVKLITNITNSTSLSLSTTAGATMTANAVLFFPAMYPLALENRSTRTVTISGSSKTATLNINKTLAATVNAIAVYNVQKTNAAPVTKTINRDLFVKIHTSNSSGGSTGPWDLGIPGVARLKNVYQGSNTTVNAASTDITKYFYIDVNDDENAYRGGRLVLANKSGVTLTANQFLMVQLDAFTTGGSEGFFTVGSYALNDTANLASSTTTINTLEIPETITKNGLYFDLRDSIDFRPYGTNTAILSTTAAGASINPPSTFALSGDDQFFPVPDSLVTFDAEFYLPRIDIVSVDQDTNFSVSPGTPSKTPVRPIDKLGQITLGVVSIPPYPSLPYSQSATTANFAAKLTGNDRGIVGLRNKSFRVAATYGQFGDLQPRRYTMAQIGSLERRISSLEYQASLNAIETSIKDTVIPSGVTPSTSRFKNGFFVEPFNDFLRANVNNKEFAASVDTLNSTLKPLTKQLNFESQFDLTDGTTLAAVVNDQTLMLPYTEETLIDQSIKSDVIGSDGHAIQFIGSMSISPSSFSILAKAELLETGYAGGTVAGVIPYIDSDRGHDPNDNGPDVGGFSGIASGGGQRAEAAVTGGWGKSGNPDTDIGGIGNGGPGNGGGNGTAGGYQ